jgi:hypothetical protein
MSSPFFAIAVTLPDPPRETTGHRVAVALPLRETLPAEGLLLAGLALQVLPEKLAKSTANIPVRNMPSKVPAPPMETTGAPSP